MASFNRIIIAGNLTRDPEFKEVGAGSSVCRLSIASNRQYKNRQTGAATQEVCYVDVDVWGPQAESCRTYLQKGRAVLVEGRLKYDTWKDAEGNARSRHSVLAERVVFLGARQEADADGGMEMGMPDTMAPSAPAAAAPRASKAKKQSSSGTAADLDAIFKGQTPFEDDLPF